MIMDLNGILLVRMVSIQGLSMGRKTSVGSSRRN
jgi:hypothetical protein